MRQRKIIAITLTIAMILSSFSMVFATETETIATQNGFQDTTNHWAESAINKWAGLGVLKGDERGFRPNDPITRAEMATVLDNMMDYQVAAENNFSDVPAGAWYAEAVLKANAAGILQGDGAGKADPMANITREQSAVMLARAFGVEENTGNNTKFNDAGSIASWARNLVFGMEAEGYIQGFEGKFNPKNSITRAEVVTIINNAVKAYYDTSGTYTDNVDGLAIIKVEGVTLKENTINGNLIIAEGVGEGDVTLDNVTVKGQTIIRGGGENSIHITGNSSIDSIRIEKVNDQVRIVISDGVTVKYVEVAAGEEIIITGQVGILELAAADVTVYATAAEINSANVSGQNSKIIVNKDSEIKEVTATAPVEISGEGTVTKVNLEKGADNSTITTPKTSINVAEGVTGTTGTGGKVIPAGETATNGNSSKDPAIVEEETSSGGGGGSGGGSSSVAVSAISVDQDLMILKVGETGSITATISPANATNKKVNWSSSDENVAIVDENGKVTAVAGGTATITVTSVADPTKKATKQVIVGDLLVPAGGNIKEVIDNAENGNVIALAPATYDIGASRIVIGKGISLIGAGYDKTIIKGTVHRAGTPVNDIVQPMLLTISKTGETLIKGIGFEWVDAEGIGNNSYSALSLAGDNVTVTECKISTNIPDTNYITIVNIGRSGGNVPGEAGVAAQNMTFTNNIVEGTISIVPSVSNIPLKVTVAGNTIEAVNMEGIWTYSLNDKDELVIEDNHISGVPDGMYDIKLMERVKSVNGNEEYTDEEISEANNNSSVLLQYMTRFVGQGEDIQNHKYSTIEAALNAAEEGDLILVTGDVEGFKVNKPVTIRGGTIESKYLPATSGNVGVYIPAEVKGVVLENVQVVGTTDAIIGIETGANVELTVKDSEISGFTTGIYLNPGSVLTATDNIISDVVAGIGSDKANLTGDVSGNTFNSCSSEGIGLNLPIKADGTVMSRQEAETLATQLEQVNTFQDCGDPPVKIYGELQEETNVEGLDASGKRVGFFETVSDALADETVATIKVYPGYHGKDPIAIVQREGVNITLEAVGDVVLKNQIKIDGGGRYEAEDTLTIRGFTFDFSDTEGDIITTANIESQDRVYAHNVTFEDCTFIGNKDNNKTVVAVRAAAKGGHTNFAFKNCRGLDLHSMGQLTSVTGVTVEDCTVENASEGGFNLPNCDDITIKNSTVYGTLYGVRTGPGGEAPNKEGQMTVSDSYLEAEYPIWLRKGSPETVVIINTELLVNTEDGERIRNDAEVNVLEDPTVYNKGLETYYMTIQEAIDAAVDGENLIKVYPGNYGPEPIDIIQQEGVNITLEAVGEVELKNQIRISGAGRWNDEETLTIKGFTFDFTDATEAVDIISATKKLLDDTNNYAHNVSIENNVFKGNPEADVVAIRTNGVFGLEIKSSQGIGLHSLGQIQGQSKYFRVIDTTVEGGESGINYYGPADVEITGLTVEGTGYGVRAGQGSGAVNETAKLTISDSNLTALYPVWLRGDAPGTVTITNSNLEPTEDGPMIYDVTSGTVNITIDGKQVLADGLTYDEANDTYEISNANGLRYYAEAINADGTYSDATVKLTQDIDLKGIEWTPIYANGYTGPGNNATLTIDGNGHTISGLTKPLIGKVWSAIKVNIKNLTISHSTIVDDEQDSKGNVGVGAFIGYTDAFDINLENCHLIGSTVKGGHWTGGLVGYLTGSDTNMGKMNILNSSVINSTINGKGSAGGLLGHATGSARANIDITNATVTGNTVTSTGASSEKAGSVMGTVGAGTVKVNNLNESNNIVKSNETIIIDRIYGRLAGGSLVID